MNAMETNGPTGSDRLCREKELPSADVLSRAVQAATSLCQTSEHFAQRLGEIDDQIEAACNIGAVRVLRFRLAEYLQQLRDQTRHQREKMAEALAVLREQLEIAQGARSSKGTNTAPDTLTGLEARGCAERALAAALDAVFRHMRPCSWWTACTSSTQAMDTRPATRCSTWFAITWRRACRPETVYSGGPARLSSL